MADHAALDRAPGWHGKLSTLGDFASRRLTPEIVRALDTWLAFGLQASQGELGEAWLPAYLASPLQRFVLGPGVLDGLWWFGILMPSCDNVGRYFPLVILQPRVAPPADRFSLDHLELWWQRAGEAALETLAESVDVERFEQTLAQLPPWPGAREPAPWAVAAIGPQATCEVPASASLTDMAQALAVAGWAQRLQGASLWWSWRPEVGTTVCRVVAGLPSGQQFAQMLGSPA
jgi:type VI secretion system protein ImpM